MALLGSQIRACDVFHCNFSKRRDPRSDPVCPTAHLFYMSFSVILSLTLSYFSRVMCLDQRRLMGFQQHAFVLLFFDGWLARLPEPGVINVRMALFGRLFSHPVIASRNVRGDNMVHVYLEIKRYEQLKTKALSRQHVISFCSYSGQTNESLGGHVSLLYFFFISRIEFLCVKF